MIALFISLTSALDGVGGQRHAPAALPSGKRPGANFKRGWVGLRAGGTDNRSINRKKLENIAD
jgi:hypothetical protein